MNLNSCEKTDELRRLALQLALQLPETVGDARRVLEMTGECLDNFLIENGARQLSPLQRARRLGWRLDGPAAAPAPAAAESPPFLSLRRALLWSLATLLLTVPLGVALSYTFGVGGPLFFAFAVIAVAMVFGTAPALVLAGVTPIVHNLLVLPPFGQFQAPTEREAIAVVFYLVFAIAVPPLLRRLQDLRRLAAGARRDVT